MKPGLKKRWMIGAIGGMVILVTLLIFNPFSTPEPLYQGRPLTAWALELNSPDPRVRSNATEAVRQIGPGAVPFLVDAAGRKESLLRKLYLSVAPKLPLAVRRATARFFRRFRTGNERFTAVQALGVLGTNVPVAPLLKALHDSDRQISAEAATALSRLGRPAVPGLIKALDDQNGYVRSMACYALSMIGPQAPEAVPALIRRFTDAHGDIPAQAVFALGQIGPPALPPLLEALKSPDERVRSQAAKAIPGVGLASHKAMPELIAATKDSAAAVRRNAVNSLGSVYGWSASREAVAAISEALEDTDSEVRIKALQALARVGRRAEPAVESVIRRLEDERPEVRALAAQVLGSVGPAAKSAIPKLSQKLNDENRAVRAQVEGALHKIQTADPASGKPE